MKAEIYFREGNIMDTQLLPGGMSTTGGSMEPATDLEILIRKGFDENEAKRALQQTRGNLEASILYLTRGGNGNSDGNEITSLGNGWNQETGNEWLDNVNSSELLTATGRAIRKSMYYLR